jgi:type II secretory pathway component PulM
MTEERDVERRDSVAWAAQVALAALADEFGPPARAALPGRPGLLARVDQHAAAIRDALADDTGAVGVTALAAYSDAVRDSASARGIDPLAAARCGLWETPPWALLRLLAVWQMTEKD